uniref:Candidate secreted effector n=1 Tax=Meloidogyne incognita TaxID=6306 RepID=A0A914NRD7_MELIC
MMEIYWLLIRFDNQIKYLQLEEIPIFVLSPNSIETFEIEVFQNKDGNGDLIGDINGCIEDLIFIYSTQTSNEDLSSSLNDNYEINYGKKIKSNLNNFCGIRDPNIWLGNTSSWGKLSRQPFDNLNNGGAEIINSIDGFSFVYNKSL